MGGLVEGVIATVGLMTGVMVALAGLVEGDAPSSVARDESFHDPRTIHPTEERIAA